MTTSLWDVIIVGGGISGLTTAHYLKRADVDVCLLEADREVGGCMQTETRDGFLLEKGPFNVIIREPAFEALLEDLSDDITIVSASRSARVRFIYHQGRLHAVPTNPIALATTQLLTLRGRCRLLVGLLASRRSIQTEETVAQAAVRRFGRETADTLVSAVIAGIFAGDTNRLSLRACFPSVAKADVNVRSLVLHALREAMVRSKMRPRWRGLISLNGGLGALAGALGKHLGPHLLTAHRAGPIRITGRGFEVDCQTGDGQLKTLGCQRLVLGSSAAQASNLLRPILPAASSLLDSIKSASLAVLNIGFRTADVGHPMGGFGFLVPHTELQFPIMGVLWADSIFPHHAPPDHRLIRVFVGGARNPEAVDQSNDSLLATALGALRDILHLRGDPVLVDVSRHRSAIPQYYLGHRKKIEQLRASVCDLPGLHLVGNYLEGVSVNDCVRVGANVASEIIGLGNEAQIRMPTAQRVAGKIAG